MLKLKFRCKFRWPWLACCVILFGLEKDASCAVQHCRGQGLFISCIRKRVKSTGVTINSLLSTYDTWFARATPTTIYRVQTIWCFMNICSDRIQTCSIMQLWSSSLAILNEAANDLGSERPYASFSWAPFVLFNRWPQNAQSPIQYMKWYSKVS